MEISLNHILDATKSVWSSILQGSLVVKSDLVSYTIDEPIIGFSRLSGEFNGGISLHLDRTVCRLASSHMFSLPSDKLTQDQLQDTTRELTNMISGSLKGVLPSPTQLTFPRTFSSEAFSLAVRHQHETRLSVGFESDHGPLVVEVLQTKAEYSLGNDTSKR